MAREVDTPEIRGSFEANNGAQNHRTEFRTPLEPFVSDRCRDLLRRLIQEPEHRLSSYRYLLKDQEIPMHSVGGSSYVFPNDAEDIKAHKWFRGIAWDSLHLQTPPFVPRICRANDTQYFEDDERISDWSSTIASNTEEPRLGLDETRLLLRGMRDDVHTCAAHLVSKPYDPRNVDRKIDAEQGLLCREREVLKQFVRAYGRKQKKPPRDPLLRDPETKRRVLSQRKRTAFVGYTWRRRRMYGYDFAYKGASTSGTAATSRCSVRNATTTNGEQPQCLM